MTISITTAPAYTFQPAYNPIVWVVSSDNTAETNFKYVFDLYLAGNVSATPDLRIKATPRPDGFGRIDMSRIIQNYTSYDFDITDITFTKNENSYQGFTIKFGEEYGGTVYADDDESSEVLAFNCGLPYQDWIGYDEDDWLVATVASKFLTNGNNFKYTDADSGYLYFIVNVADEAKTLQIKTYDIDGNLVQTATATNAYADLSDNDERFIRVPAMPLVLNQLTLATGSQNLVTASIYSYTLQMLDNGAAVSSEIITFTRNVSTCQDTSYRVHFKNRLGGFDGFDFIRATVKNTSIRRSEFAQVKGTVDGSGVETWGSEERGRSIYNVEITDNWLLRSDWLTDAESTWLKELLTSGEVFIQVGSVLMPIVVVNSGYTEKTTTRDKLFELELEVSFDNERVNI
jgi:hypothetical protein